MIYNITLNDGLAFDHAKIIAAALMRIRGKIAYTPIALHLMPTLFTLTEFQQVYEAVLDKKLLKSTFRRKVGHLVEETDNYIQIAGRRPARLYKRKWSNLN